jgi:hypothetical protein
MKKTAQLMLGRCDVCGFKGVLERQAYFNPGDMDGPVVIRKQCETCRHTPTGVWSPNMQPKRLPDADYLVK